MWNVCREIESRGRREGWEITETIQHRKEIFKTARPTHQNSVAIFHIKVMDIGHSKWGLLNQLSGLPITHQ